MKNHQNKNLPTSKSTYQNLHTNIDNFFRNFFAPDFPDWRNLPTFSFDEDTAAFTPAVEVEENDNEIVVCMDVPGIHKNDIRISVEDNNLVVSGERKYQREENKKGRHFSERSYGSFYRSFPLPSNVNAELIKADCNDGVLEISLPKTEVTKARTIAIGKNEKVKSVQ